ncbi:hypothetical protein K8I31_15430 [bacterium]|nr:hypothetical protein [bacterium]
MIDPQISVPLDYQSFEVSIDGILMVISNFYFSQQIGQIQLYVFPNPDALESTSEGYFIETKESGTPIAANPMWGGVGMLLQGYRLLNAIPPDWPEHLVYRPEENKGVNDDNQEALIKTVREWDYAIDGPGFIKVDMPTGLEGFTRYLNFNFDLNEQLVRETPYLLNSMEHGLKVLDPIGRIIYPPSPPVLPVPTPANNSNPKTVVQILPVDPTAEVSTEIKFKTPDEIHQEIRDLPIYRFASPEKLRYWLNGVYLETEESGGPIEYKQGENGAGVLKQGYLNDVPRLEP